MQSPRKKPLPSESKEEFCGACGAGLVALLGVGTATTGTNVKNNRKMKKYIFWTGFTITLLSILVLAYYLHKECAECA